MFSTFRSVNKLCLIDRIFYFLANMYAQIEIAVTKQYLPFEMLEQKLVIRPN